ncbi:MAG: prolyl oligopeptidase family serine peptidase [Oscillospiraceae bacterium]|nr:prolyl oligopeptidase family serine peptidase [Oscillospiraceae bacterium]
MDYHACEGHLRERFESAYKPYAFRAGDAAGYRRWKAAFRARLEGLLGFGEMEPCAPNPRVASAEACDGYVRQKVLIDTEPGVCMPMYVLRPEAARPGDRLPVMVAAHGHGSNGKDAVCGIDGGRADMAETIGRYNYAYGVRFAKEGFMVLCPDARGFGERREKYQQDDRSLLGSSCGYLNAIAIPLGMSVTGMWAWDLMRLVDYALTRGDADPGRVCCAGLSGGGLQSMWLAAMDDRVMACVISGYMYGYGQSLLEMHNCACNYVPGLWGLADMGDIAALIADRGVFIETGDSDGLNGSGGLGNVRPQVETIERAAAAVGNGGNVRHHVFSGGHRWCGEESVPWVSGMAGLRRR